MSQYECAVVLAPTLTDEQIQEHTELIKTWITGLGAEVSAVDVWGRKRLAYPVRKHQEGFYVIYYFTLDSERSRLTDLSRRANTTETILRHLVVRLPALKEPPRLPKEEEEEGQEVERVGPGETKPEPEGTATIVPAEGATQVQPTDNEPAPAAENPPVATE